jgi:hypothetical protein
LKNAQTVDISRYRIVVEVALYDRLEPFARLLDRIMHAFAKLLFDLPQLRPHAFPDGLPPNGKFAVPVFPADVRVSRLKHGEIDVKRKASVLSVASNRDISLRMSSIIARNGRSGCSFGTLLLA